MALVAAGLMAASAACDQSGICEATTSGCGESISALRSSSSIALVCCAIPFSFSSTSGRTGGLVAAVEGPDLRITLQNEEQHAHDHDECRLPGLFPLAYTDMEGADGGHEWSAEERVRGGMTTWDVAEAPVTWPWSRFGGPRPTARQSRALLRRPGFGSSTMSMPRTLNIGASASVPARPHG